MRAFFRLIINLALLADTAVTGGWVTTLKPYHDATKDGRTAMLVGVVVAFFVIACIALYLVPSAEQLKKRQAKKKGASSGSYAYGVPAKRR